MPTLLISIFLRNFCDLCFPLFAEDKGKGKDDNNALLQFYIIGMVQKKMRVIKNQY